MRLTVEACMPVVFKRGGHGGWIGPEEVEWTWASCNFGGQRPLTGPTVDPREGGPRTPRPAELLRLPVAHLQSAPARRTRRRRSTAVAVTRARDGAGRKVVEREPSAHRGASLVRAAGRQNLIFRGCSGPSRSAELDRAAPKCGRAGRRPTSAVRRRWRDER